MTWLAGPTEFSAYALAEHMEMELLVSEDARLSLSEVRDAFTSGQVPTEEEFEYALQEIADRSIRLGSMYPYDRDGDSVVITAAPAKFVYGLLGLFSLQDTPFRLAKEYRRSDPLFDAVVRECVVAALGDGASAVCFGYPSRDERPEPFPDAVHWVAELIGVGLRSNEAYAESADGGVDIIGWNRFPDFEVGFPLMLVQNTIQRNFVKKPRDVIAQDWREWIRVKADPMVGFAVPFAMPPSDNWWERSASNVTYMWDRRRIVWQLRESDPTEWAEYPEIERFVEDEIQSIRGQAPVPSHEGDDRSAAGPSKVAHVARPRKVRAGTRLIGSNPAENFE